MSSHSPVHFSLKKLKKKIKLHTLMHTFYLVIKGSYHTKLWFKNSSQSPMDYRVKKSL